MSMLESLKMMQLGGNLVFYGLAALGLVTTGSAWAACAPGIYARDANNFVVIGAPLAAPATGQRYLFLDGRRGSTTDALTPVRCDRDAVAFSAVAGDPEIWPRIRTVETDATFMSDASKLTGQLIEPPGPPDPKRPLVVLVHGSEKTSAIGSVYGYMLAAQGISVFVYNKRGTGTSEGEYTQNFELLADDAAAALMKARDLTMGRHGRTGFFGGSQGGWVAPLAATRAPADFVAIGFGLVVSPIEEDREQMLDEAKTMKLDKAAVAKIEDLSRATARMVRSHFATGFEELARVKRQIGDPPWSKTIEGEYSGDMLRMNDADLRRIGRARFDNLELIWDYDAYAVLQRLNTPLLWVLAGEDREAPIAETRQVLSKLAADSKPLDMYLFPNTDHGIFEFRTNADGTRTPTRIADGYLRLLADWIKDDSRGTYGHAEKIH